MRGPWTSYVTNGHSNGGYLIYSPIHGTHVVSRMPRLQDDSMPNPERERIVARFPHFFRAPVDDSESGSQDESSTVTDETGMLTPTTTEAGDSEPDAHN
jgi:hypothetical protein